MGGHAGAFSLDVAQLLGGAVLVLSFGLLLQRRLGGLINTYAAQSAVLAAAACWQGWAQSAPALVVTGLLVLGGAGVAIPVALHRIAGRQQGDRAVVTQPGVFAALAAGGGLVLLAVLLAAPATSEALPGEDLVLSLSVLLLGQLMMIVRPATPARLVGFLSLLSGLILGVVSVPGLRLAVELSAGVLMLAGAAVAGVSRLDGAER